MNEDGLWNMLPVIVGDLFMAPRREIFMFLHKKSRRHARVYQVTLRALFVSPWMLRRRAQRDRTPLAVWNPRLQPLAKVGKSERGHLCGTKARCNGKGHERCRLVIDCKRGLGVKRLESYFQCCIS